MDSQAIVHLTSDTELWFKVLLITATVLLVPLATVGLIILVKLMFLLHTMHEFLKQIRYEITPLLKEVRIVAEALGNVGSSVMNNANKLKNLGSKLQPGFEKLGVSLKDLLDAAISLLQQKFSRSGRANGAGSSSTQTSHAQQVGNPSSVST